MYLKVAAFSTEEVSEQYVIDDLVDYMGGFNEEASSQLKRIDQEMVKLGIASILVNDELLNKHELLEYFNRNKLGKNMCNVFSCLLKKEIVKYFAAAMRKKLGELEVEFTIKQHISANSETVKDINRSKRRMDEHQNQIININKAVILILEHKFNMDERSYGKLSNELRHLEAVSLSIIADIADRFVLEKTTETLAKNKKVIQASYIKSTINEVFAALRGQLAFVS